MKIRSDFVTNSSSSSFILNASDMSISSVAHRMVGIVEEDWTSDDGGYIGLYATMFKDIKRHLKEDYVNTNLGIQLPSTNYDTYIFNDEEGHICVSTCNNQDWSEFYSLDISTDGDEADDLLQDMNEKGLCFFHAKSGRIITGNQIYCDALKRDASGLLVKSETSSFGKVGLDMVTGEFIMVGSGLAVDYIQPWSPSDEKDNIIIADWKEKRKSICDNYKKLNKKLPEYLVNGGIIQTGEATRR